MSMNTTPAAERIHIGIFGRRNAGKSSLINAITSQSLAIVSEQKGTTTDPVYKAMELLPLGPVMFIDTPGLDDEGELGAQRVEKAYQVLHKCDMALLVVDATVGISEEDKRLWALLEAQKRPAVLVLNKADKLGEMQQALAAVDALKLTKHCFLVSTQTKRNINELKEAIAALRPKEQERHLLDDLLKPCDTVILVTPIDSKLWRFLRLRPQNFPHIRLSQLANLYFQRKASLSQLLDATSVKEAKQVLSTSVTPYWETHYTFGSESIRNEKHISPFSLNLLVINTVIPILFAYGRHRGEEKYCDRAFDFLESLHAENNHIVRMWQQCGLPVENAGDSQALIQLKKEYCDKKECLRCRIGYEYLKRK